MSKSKKRIVRLTESEMVDLIERIVETVKSEKESLKESKRLETRRKDLLKENNKKKH